MAFLVFGLILIKLIKNNVFLKKMYEDYLIQRGRFNKYYKKKFPIFYYGLPVVEIISLIGLFYTLQQLDATFQDPVLKTNALWDTEYILRKYGVQLYGFFFVYLSCIFTHLGILLYVIKYANNPREKFRKFAMTVAKITGTIVSRVVIRMHNNSKK
jgi:hypothetical protein